MASAVALMWALAAGEAKTGHIGQPMDVTSVTESIKKAVPIKKSVSKPFIEDFVFDKLSEYVFNDAYIPLIADEYNTYLKDKSGDDSNLLRSLQGKLKAINIDLENLSNILIKTNSLTLLDKLDQLETEKYDIETKISQLKYKTSVTKVTEDELKLVFSKIRTLLKSGKLSNMKFIVETYINRIEVYKEKVIVQFNFFPEITIEGCAYAQPSIYAHQHNFTNADDLTGEGGI